MLRDLIALPDTSRVWIYQGDREFTYDEIDVIREAVYNFVHAWQSHGIPVQAYGNVFHKRFVVFVADETGHGVSGCSTDASVNLVKQVGAKLQADFFKRTDFAIMRDNEEIETIDKDDFVEAYQSGKIDDKTLVFDHLVKDKGAFLKRWIIPLEESWHARFV